MSGNKKLEEMAISVIAAVIVLSVVAGMIWYWHSVYVDCRSSGNGPLFCWHMLGR